jgi:plastocyanin
MNPFKRRGQATSPADRFRSCRSVLTRHAQRGITTWIDDAPREPPIGCFRSALPSLLGSPAPLSRRLWGGGDVTGASASATARFPEGTEGSQCGVQRGMPAMITMVDGLRFEPAQVTVPAGTTVLWRNMSADSHTVTTGPRRPARPEQGGSQDRHENYVLSWTRVALLPQRSSTG